MSDKLGKWDKARLIIEQKKSGQAKECRYCQRQIKGKKYRIEWKFSDRIWAKPRVALKDLTNMRYVRFAHPGCPRGQPWKKLQAAFAEIRKKVSNKILSCEHCGERIQGEYYISHRFSKRILDKGQIPPECWTNMRYVRFAHASCAKRFLAKLLGKQDAKS